MKEIIGQNIHILSQRALDFLKSPLHLSGEVTAKWRFTIENISENSIESDKILTLSWFDLHASSIERLFMEAISRLSVGRNILFLEKLSFREVENFLRDQNHLPVFEESESCKPDEVFKVVKNSLLGALLLNKIRQNHDCSKLGSHWEELSLVKKNSLLKEVITLLNSLFPRGKSIVLTLAEEEEISIIMNDFPMPIEVIEAVVLDLIGCAYKKTSLKVVAVQ